MKSSIRQRTVHMFIQLAICLTMVAGPVLAEPARIAVFPFDLRTRQDISFLADGILDMLESRLHDRGRVELVNREDVNRRLGDARTSLSDATLLEIAADLNADYAISGEVIENDDGTLATTARMFFSNGNRRPVEFIVRAPVIADLLPATSELAAAVNLQVFNRVPKADASGGTGSHTQVDIHAHPETIDIDLE